MEIERKLATIETILELIKHPNADTLEIAKIRGWNVIVKKGEFKVGEQVLYFEIDSVIPEYPELEWLRDRCYIDNGIVKGFRIKTLKLRKVISQGLIVKLDNFIKYLSDTGEDLTKQLKVQLYSKPIPENLQGKVKGNFPSFIPKTDEVRIENIFEFEKIKPQYFITTEKIDGTSCTYYYNNKMFGVCSRNLELIEDNSAYWLIAKKYNLETKMKLLGINLAIQGEIFGYGINGNYLKKTDIEFRVFSIYDIDKKVYLDYEQMEFVCKEFGLELVPILDKKFETLNIEELKIKSEGKSKLNDTVEREGIVIRNADKSISFKIINPVYLLQE